MKCGVVTKPVMLSEISVMSDVCGAECQCIRRVRSWTSVSDDVCRVDKFRMKKRREMELRQS